jgi:putative aminopeptidase FrvX
MNLKEESPTMQVSVDVSDEMRREAESRGLPIIDYVELLVEKGRQAMGEGKVVSSALERIRALTSKDKPSRS